MPTELVPVDEGSDEEYADLLRRLDETFPTVSGAGFDFSAIRGGVERRTAKAMVLHLACSGWSISRISDTLGVSADATGRYLAEAIRDAVPIEDVNILRRFELMKLDRLEQLCHEQFLRSCGDKETVTAVVLEDGSEETVKTVTRGQAGSPTYQRVLLEISKQRARLLGLEAPQKVAVDKTSKKLVITEVIVRNREEALAAQAAGLLPGPGEDDGK